MAKNNLIGAELPVLVASATKILEAVKLLAPFGKAGTELGPVVGSLRNQLDAILVKILRSHLAEVEVWLDPRRPQCWDDNFAVLEIVVDGKKFRMPVPKLRDMEPGITKELRNNMAKIFVRDSKVSEILLTGMGYGRDDTPKALAVLGADGIWRGSVRTLNSAPVGYKGGVIEFKVPNRRVWDAIRQASTALEVRDFEVEWSGDRPHRAVAGDKFYVYPFKCPEIGQVGSNFVCPECGAPHRAGLGEVGLSDDRNTHLPTGRVYPAYQDNDPNPGIPWEVTDFLFYGGKAVVLEEGQWQNQEPAPFAVKISRSGGKVRLGTAGPGAERFWLFELDEAEKAIQGMLPGVPFYPSREGAPREIRDRIMDLF